MRFNETHIFDFRVEFDDLDAGGVVHHPKYLNFIERARSAAMRDAGYSFAQCMKDGFCFVVSETRTKYLKPALYEQNLRVLSRMIAGKRSSLKVFQSIVTADVSSVDIQNAGDNFFSLQQTLFMAQLRLVCVGLPQLVPKEMSQTLKDVFGVPTPEVLSAHPERANTVLGEAW